MQNFSDYWVGNILLRSMEIKDGNGIKHITNVNNNNNNNVNFTDKEKRFPAIRTAQKKKRSWKSWKQMLKLKEWIFKLHKTKLYWQMVNFKMWFNWRDFFIGFLLNLVPTALDISTDFNLARQMNLESKENRTAEITYDLFLLGKWTTNIHSQFATFTYLFISLPGIILIMKMVFFKAKHTWTSHLLNHKCCHLALNLVALALTLTAAHAAVILATISVQEPFFILAIFSAVFTLTVNLARVFVHSEEMKELALKVTTAEEQYESAFQIHLFFLMWLVGAHPSGSVAELWLGQVTSVLMVAKVTGFYISSNLLYNIQAGAESLMARESDENQERRSVRRLLKLIPVCGITAIFRMGSYAMMINWSFRQRKETLWIFNTVQRDVLLLFLVPVVVLWLLQQKIEVLKPLTTMDIVQGVVGEMATIPVWEKLPTKESKRLNLGMAVYYLLLWSLLLLVAIFCNLTPWNLVPWCPNSRGDFLGGNARNSSSSLDLDSNAPCPPCTQFAIFCLLCGWFSFPLFLHQIFFAAKSSLVGKMRVLVSVIYQ